MQRAAVIRSPVAGCELKPCLGGKARGRVRGPMSPPGTTSARPDRGGLDDEGFYRIGDAVKFADRRRREKHLFDARRRGLQASTGTWVNAGAVRIRLNCRGHPLIQDAVITGHDRDSCALVFLSPAARICRRERSVPP